MKSERRGGDTDRSQSACNVASHIRDGSINNLFLIIVVACRPIPLPKLQSELPPVSWITPQRTALHLTKVPPLVMPFPKKVADPMRAVFQPLARRFPAQDVNQTYLLARIDHDQVDGEVSRFFPCCLEVKVNALACARNHSDIERAGLGERTDTLGNGFDPRHRCLPVSLQRRNEPLKQAALRHGCGNVLWSPSARLQEPADARAVTGQARRALRSGRLWTIGKGKVFYFRPGHELYPIYKEPIPIRIVENAVRWMASEVKP